MRSNVTRLPYNSDWYRLRREVREARGHAEDAARICAELREEQVQREDHGYWHAKGVEQAIRYAERERLSWLLAVVALMGWVQEPDQPGGCGRE